MTTNKENVLYTDGHNVKVTDTDLQVKNHNYKLAGIYRMWLQTLPAVRWPGILLISLGLVAILCGWLGVLPYQATLDAGETNLAMNPNVMAIWLGLGLAIIGTVVVLVVKERYAVRIATAEGDKNAVVSTEKEYVRNIVDAIYAGVERFDPRRTTQEFRRPA